MVQPLPLLFSRLTRRSVSHPVTLPSCISLRPATEVYLCNRSLNRSQSFSTTSLLRVKPVPSPTHTVQHPQSDADEQPAANISHDVSPEEKDAFSRIEKESKRQQVRSPWMREGSDKPPVSGPVSAGAMTKGKLLTTPSRMLKLILPLTTRDANKDRKTVEPLALLVHPQQPLSYLERLIQSELPTIKDKDGNEKIPIVTFRAEDSARDDINPESPSPDELWKSDIDDQYELDNAETQIIDGKLERTGKIQSDKQKEQPGPQPSAEPVASTEEDDMEKLDRENGHENFVRWSPSTEIGDFIRDASGGKEFAVDIEGAPHSIYVGVPSFKDRTYYLRMRLRKTAKRIASLADIKQECDTIARRGAKRVAQGGFLGLLGWWASVFYLTFKTDLGWDTMEPVTYLVSLSGIIGANLWFLFHNREISYRSAMNLTVSRRQSQLYEQKGFNIQLWEGLVEEGNRLRREIKMVADEYDVEWNESKDEGDERVREALKEERKKHKNGKNDKKDKDDDDDDD